MPAERDALVVLASPVTTFAPLLRQIDEFAPTVRLTDVASVKSVVAEQVSDLAPQTRYVGSHPMAGTAQSGWRAGSPTLFDGAAWVTCLTEESDADDWAGVAGVALAVGSRVVPAEPQAHDAAVARISHLPHIMALALAQVGEQGGALALSLAASSFADATRVAGTRPALVRAMCEANREALVDALDDALGIMGVARGSLASTGSLAKITQAGHQARARFDGRADELTAVTLEGDGDGGPATGRRHGRRSRLRVRADAVGARDHGVVPGPGVGGRDDRPAQRFPRAACSRSIDSNSALKLPLPKPSEPCRSISSKKIVGRSPSGLVKICSR